HPAAGGQAAAHVGNRFLLWPAKRISQEARRDCAGQRGEARLLYQQRCRIGRGRLQVGPLPHGPAAHDRLLRRLSWPHGVRACAVIIVEPIQGERVYIAPPLLFHRSLRKLCDKHVILLVADEVQSGMGRTGKMFALEHWNVVPDIVCLAKGIASGMPLGAIIAKVEVMDWPSGSHASTFGGNPVSCRAALTTLDLLEQGYIANAALRGEQLRKGLLDLR